MSTNRPLGRLAAALAVAVLIVPTAALAQDLRSPDARDAASAPVATQVADDLRSPDAIDAAGYTPIAVVSPADLRTPDARDAADGRQVISNPIVVVKPAADTFDWGDAAIGAAAALVLVGLGGAAAWLVRRRRTTAPVTGTPVRARVRHPSRVRGGARTRGHVGTR